MVLIDAHDLAYSGNVGIIPSVVVYERGAVGHACNLVAVVPPAHYAGIMRSVLSKPRVCFAVVIDDPL